jgi:methionyl-tRNA synthetase
MNADLANDLGNLAQRSLSMIARNCDGVLPAPKALSAEDRQILAATDGLLPVCREAMKTQQIHQALSAVWAVVADANRYFAAAEPWALRKTDPARMETVLYVTAEVVRQVAILAQPAVPASAGKLLDLLAVSEAARNFAHLGEAGRLAGGTTLPAPRPIFPRFAAEAKDGKGA